MGLFCRNRNESTMMVLDRVAVTVATVGSLNWAPEVFGRMDFVARIAGETIFDPIIKGAVVVAGAYLAYEGLKGLFMRK